MSDFIERWSPNFDGRALAISMIVLHYTGMKTRAEAIDRLADPAAGVSAHYVVSEDGQITHMVPEDKRAWHAGKAHWRGIRDVNSASVGIEIVNPGHEWGYVPFPAGQVASVVRLVHIITDRHAITPGNVVGPSDTPPAPQPDPGECFPWGTLATPRPSHPGPPRQLAHHLSAPAGSP